MIPQILLPTVLYVDSELLGINKPAGLLSIPDGYHPELPHLAQALQPEFGKVWIVHRLDKETSGAILLARSLEIHHLLNTQFESRQVQKLYHALILGMPEWESIEINQPLRVNGDRRHRTVVATLTGKPAQTNFRILQRFEGICLVEAQPHTGYTHQIRAHLAAAGFPILADPLYGKIQTTRNEFSTGLLAGVIHRTALHASAITFYHPRNQQSQTILAPYPEDFTEAVRSLSLPKQSAP